MADRYWVGGSGTWDATTTTNWSTVTGGAGGASVPTSADNVIFDQAATYTVTISGTVNCLSFTTTAGTITFAGTGPVINVYGSMTLATGTTSWTVTTATALNFLATTSVTLTTNGASLLNPTITFNGVGGTWTLGSALNNATSTKTITITNGTLNTSASNYAISTGNISVGASGTLTLNASTITLSGITPITITGTINAGTSTINCTSTSNLTFAGGGKTFYNVSFTGVTTSSFTMIINGANTFNNLTFTPASGAGIPIVSFGGDQIINGTLTGSGPSEVRRIFYRSNTYGTAVSLTLAAATSLPNCDFRDITAVTNAITATGGGNCGGNTNITGFPAAKTVYWNLAGAQNWSATGWATTPTGTPALSNFPLAQDTAIFTNSGSVTGTITIETIWNIGTLDMSGRTSAMTLSIGVAFPLYGNWLNGTGTTLSGTGTIFFSGRGTTQQITSNGVAFTQSITATNIGGIVRLIDNLRLDSTRTVTLSNGTLDLQSFTITTGVFSSSNINARTLAFGTGSITVNGTGTVFTIATATNFNSTGSQIVNVNNNTATATTVNAGALSLANSISFNFVSGTYALTFLSTASESAGDVDFTGFSGTWNATSSGFVYGSLTLSPTMTLTASASLLTFGSTTSSTITTYGKTLDFPVTFDGVGGTWQLIDNLTVGSTRTTTLTNGTINLNGRILNPGISFTTATGTKNITFNGGTIQCDAATTTAFNNAASANFTTTAGTGVGKISMTAATAKTFVGSGSTYNCLLENAGAGTLTISGSNTFLDIDNSVQPTTFTFTSGTTTTLTNFSVSGTAGNLVTINSTTPGSAATLTLDNFRTISASYLSIQDSTVTGGIAWYAGTTSTNVSNNTGWLFTNPVKGIAIPTGVTIGSGVTFSF